MNTETNLLSSCMCSVLKSSCSKNGEDKLVGFP